MCTKCLASFSRKSYCKSHLKMVHDTADMNLIVEITEDDEEYNTGLLGKIQNQQNLKMFLDKNSIFQKFPKNYKNQKNQKKSPPRFFKIIIFF
jgi:uncharacterized surface protein with fasciclin (FAS1) repeats